MVCDVRPRSGYFLCSNTTIRILPNSLCDGIVDCPHLNDESNCAMNNSQCPNKCQCFLFSIVCQSSSVMSSFQHQNLHVLNWTQEWKTATLVIGLADLKLLRFSGVIGSLSVNFVIKSRNLLTIICSKSGIQTIETNSFQDLQVLQYVFLDSNTLKELRSNIFQGSHKVTVLNAKHNCLTYLQKQTFTKLPELRYLDISGNQIITVDRDIFERIADTIHVQFSSDLFFCLPNVRHHQKDKTVDCGSLLLMSAANIVAWITGILTLSENAIAFYLHKSVRKHRHRLQDEVKSAYNIAFQFFCFPSVQYGVYILLLVSADSYFGDSIVFKEFNWKKSFLCFVMYLLFLNSNMASSVSYVQLGVARFFVVCFPLNTIFKNPDFVKKLSLAHCGTVALIASVGTTFNFVETMPRLCNPSVSDLVSARVINFVLLFTGIVSIIILPIVYFAIYFLVRKKETDLPKKATVKKSSFLLNICWKVFSFYLSWIPSVTLSFLAFLTHFVHKVIVWHLIVIMPCFSTLILSHISTEKKRKGPLAHLSMKISGLRGSKL